MRRNEIVETVTETQPNTPHNAHGLAAVTVICRQINELDAQRLHHIGASSCPSPYAARQRHALNPDKARDARIACSQFLQANQTSDPKSLIQRRTHKIIVNKTNRCAILPVRVHEMGSSPLDRGGTGRWRQSRSAKTRWLHGAQQFTHIARRSQTEHANRERAKENLHDTRAHHPCHPRKGATRF